MQRDAARPALQPARGRCATARFQTAARARAARPGHRARPTAIDVGGRAAERRRRQHEMQRCGRSHDQFDDVTDATHARDSPVQADRHIGAERRGDVVQFGVALRGAKQPQGRGGVGRATAQAGLGRNAFVEPQPARRPERGPSPHDEVRPVCRRRARWLDHELRAAGTLDDRQLVVGLVDDGHERVELVEAVGAAPEHAQRKRDLRRGALGGRAVHETSASAGRVRPARRDPASRPASAVRCPRLHKHRVGALAERAAQRLAQRFARHVSRSPRGTSTNMRAGSSTCTGGCTRQAHPHEHALDLRPRHEHRCRYRTGELGLAHVRNVH